MSFNQSLRVHAIIALLLGLWVYLFLALIAPFDTATLQPHWRAKIMIGYGLVFSFSYLMVIPAQRWEASRRNWNWSKEVVSIIAVFLVCWPLSFLYYKSELILGEYSISEFTFGMFLPSSLLLIPIAFISRRIGATKPLTYELGDQKLVIQGKYKTDVLQISFQSLVAIQAAGNYVEIHYHELDQLNKKLIRSTLKEMKTSVPSLLQVHRSFLINPNHSISWKDTNTIQLSNLEIPISKQFQDSLLKVVKTHH